MKWRLSSRTKEVPQLISTLDGVFICDTEEKCLEAVGILNDAGCFGLDTEYAGFMKDGSPWDGNKFSPVGHASVVSMQFSTPDVPYIFVPNWGPWTGFVQHFREVLEDTVPKKILHNAKADMHALANHGIHMRGLLADTMIMDFCYNSAELHALKECAHRYFGLDTETYNETFKIAKPLKKGGFSNTVKILPHLTEVVKSQRGVTKLIDYSVKDPKYTLDLYRFLVRKLRGIPWVGGYKMLDYYKLFEREYTEVLFDIERRGCLIDVEHLKAVQTAITEDMTEAKKLFLKACVKAGVPPTELTKFNPRSKPQIGYLLETKLGVTFRQEHRTKTGKPKCDEDTLAKIKCRRPVRAMIDLLLTFSRLDTLKKNFIDKLVFTVGEYGGRLHTTLKQIGTKTARLASSAPNLQNIPTGSKDIYGIRKAFIAPEGQLVGDIDLSQIEMRIAAHVTKDPVMLNAIRNGWDLHSLTTTRISEEARDLVGGREITKELLDEVKSKFKQVRDEQAKVLNFMTLYGGGAYRFMQMSGATEAEANRVIASFWEYYKGLKKGIHHVQRKCFERGYITTFIGRRVYVPNIRHPDPKWRKQAERQAFNYTIQGSAADLLKMAMILIHRDEELKKSGVKMVLQIHDELLFELPNGVADRVKPVLEEYVSHPYRVRMIHGKRLNDLAVDTPAEFGVGPSWKEAKG